MTRDASGLNHLLTWLLLFYYHRHPASNNAMSIDATSTKPDVIQNKLKRRASSSSELTSVSDSADRSGNKRAKNGDHSGKPTERVKVDTPGEHKEKGVYCHQWVPECLQSAVVDHRCHRKCLDDGADTSLGRGRADQTDYLRCTRLKTFKKDGPKRACNITYCARDLKVRYDIEAATVKANGMGNDAEGHEGSYLFTCPCCTEECQCALCECNKRPLMCVADGRSEEEGARAARVSMNYSDETIPR